MIAQNDPTADAESILTPPSARELLESPTGRDAIARGGVNVLSFEAVQDSLGARWAARREQVWDYIRQALERRFARTDIIERVSETEFLVLTSAENGAVAQTACLRCLQEILIHFLGACRPSDLVVKNVSGIDGVELTCRQIDPISTFQAADLHSEARQAHAIGAEAKGAAHAAALSSSVRGHDLTFSIENVISVRHAALAGGRVRREVVPHGGDAPLSRLALCALDTATLAMIDLDTVALARDILAGPSAGAFPLLRAPVSLQTLGHSNSRKTYLNLLRSLPPEATRRIIIEIVNLDEGTPASRVREAVSFLHGACRTVVAFTDPTARALAPLRDAGVGGVTVEAEQFGRLGSDRRLAIAAFAESAKAVSVRTAIRGVLSEMELAAARAVDITYLIVPQREKRLAAA
jgi:GGDEF domain-containing protein